MSKSCQCEPGSISEFASPRSVRPRTLLRGKPTSELLAAAAISGACAVGLAAPAQAGDGYIAIAGSDSSHSVEITAGGSLASLDSVEDYAVNHCAERHGASDCRILAVGVGGCVALSDDGHRFVGAWGATRNAAGAAAVAKVGLAGAAVHVARCVGDPGLNTAVQHPFWVTQ
ncbi:DUF4189 domain-containing protein [Mycobacterium vulneris]|jgi:hypothetical protein|uniref:DUF4189 domain-containing protein n=2 Tax=Mycolicibacterium vulneris TaxID=547163 RepID=A0A1X2KVW9_9MYCO|nr:DUF4189 domain-containing protein [Mycolicibacterium vulneris]